MSDRRYIGALMNLTFNINLKVDLTASLPLITASLPLIIALMRAFGLI
jgi:hypothetical protein